MFALVGPGAIVKKITNEKSVDRFRNFCYTIIVKGRMIETDCKQLLRHYMILPLTLEEKHKKT